MPSLKDPAKGKTANTDLQGPVCTRNLYYMRRPPWDAENKGIEGSTGTQEPAWVTPDPLSMWPPALRGDPLLFRFPGRKRDSQDRLGCAENWGEELGLYFGLCCSPVQPLESALISWRIKGAEPLSDLRLSNAREPSEACLIDQHPKSSSSGDCVLRLERVVWLPCVYSPGFVGNAGVLLEQLGLETVRNTLFLKGNNLENWKPSLPFHTDEQKSFSFTSIIFYFKFRNLLISAESSAYVISLQNSKRGLKYIHAFQMLALQTMYVLLLVWHIFQQFQRVFFFLPLVALNSASTKQM